MSSSLIQLKNEYLSKQKKTLIDDTIFKDFSMDCIGIEITIEHEHLQKIEKRKKLKQPLILRYIPENKYKKKPKKKYMFLNSSGEEIKNPENMLVPI